MRYFVRIGLRTLACLSLLSVASGVRAGVLTFEGVGDFNPVGNFYNGGAGPNLGVSFSPAALAWVDSDAGGTGNFGGEPSPSTVILAGAPANIVMDRAAGFVGSLGFYYSAPIAPITVSIFSGAGGTGLSLATQAFGTTAVNGAPDPTGVLSPLVFASLNFAAVAQSVVFSGPAGAYVLDDISFTPVAIPEPGTVALLASGLVSLAGMARQRRRRG
jgi:hypothetical protein